VARSGWGCTVLALGGVDLTGQTDLVVIISLPKRVAQSLDLGTESAGGVVSNRYMYVNILYAREG
jgi:hypothetical protein